MIQIVNGVQGIETPEKRKELSDKIADNHPLKKFTNTCIAESKGERPSADQVSKELKYLLEAHAYTL